MQPHPSRAFVDVHILQTVPPANLNRDDQGNPKEAVFGGVRRSRVSSQAWKRATRMHFDGRVPASDLGTRTRRLEAALASRLKDTFTEEQAGQVSAAVVDALGVGRGKKAGDTAYLLFYGRSQLETVAALLREQAGTLAARSGGDLHKAVSELPVQEAFDTGHPLDVALFGRMVADIRALKVDAAVQVAHALSTHEVDLEFDYFTAVDDEAQQNQETGAGMIGTIGFNSATLYRYATVAVHKLRDNLSDDEATAQGVRQFVSSFARSVPSGYENAFAHRTLPSLVAVVVREDQPVNLVSAFEDPVRGAGLAAGSARRLAKEHVTALANWGDVPLFTAVCHSFADTPTVDQISGAFGPPTDFPGVLEGLARHVTQSFRAVAR